MHTGWLVLQAIFFFILYLIGVQIIFGSILSKILGGRDEFERISLTKTFVHGFWSIGLIVFILYLVLLGGMSETLFGVFSGTGMIVVAGYFFVYMKTSHIDAYIIVLTGKNYDKGDYLMVYGKNGNYVTEGEFHSLSIRNLVLLPYRETSLVQIPIPALVGPEGLIIKNMDRGSVGIFQFDMIAHLDADVTKIKSIIFDILNSHQDILSNPVPWVKVDYNLGYYTLKFNYYCAKDDVMGGYMKAKNVWLNLSIRIIEALRAENIKIGLSESIWLNGQYKEGDTKHLQPNEAKSKLDNPITLGAMSLGDNNGTTGKPS